MSLVRLRIDIERKLRGLARGNGVAVENVGVGQLLQQLRQAGVLPASVAQFEAALQAFNAAVHGVDVAPEAAAAATAAGTRFLADLDRMNRP